MTSLKCSNLLSSFNAIAYEVPPLPEEMTSFGDDDPLQVVTSVDLDYETTRDEWEPVTTAPDQAEDSRLPRVFVDGALNSVEVAGSAQDGMGCARSIRAGQLGVGAVSLDEPARSVISCNFLLAITTMGYSATQVAPLRSELQDHSRVFDLITWDGISDAYFKTPGEREIAIQDAATVRRRLRRRVTDAMLEREQALVRQVSAAVYADGRYVDHLPLGHEQLVIGVIKTMRRHYLDIVRLHVLYNLKAGQRTPAFEIESQHVKVVSFYARISSVAAGATNGLVRVEMSKSHFEDHQQQDWSLLDAVTAHMTRLGTRDSTYIRAAVTLEPIRVIEQRIQRLFHPTESIAVSVLNALR